MIINPTVLRSIAKAAPQIKKATQAAVAAPNGALTLSVGQAKTLSKLFVKDPTYKALISELSKVAEKVIGKNGTVTVAKEASKYTKGAAVVRASISKGSEPVIKLAAKINPTTPIPSYQIGASLPGVHSYGIGNLSALGPEVLDDLALSVGKKGDVLSYAFKAGEYGKSGAKVNPKEYAGFIDKVAGMDLASKTYQGLLDKAGEAIKEIKAAFMGKAPKKIFPEPKNFVKSMKTLDPKVAESFKKAVQSGKIDKLLNPKTFGVPKK